MSKHLTIEERLRWVCEEVIKLRQEDDPDSITEYKITDYQSAKIETDHMKVYIRWATPGTINLEYSRLHGPPQAVDVRLMTVVAPTYPEGDFQIPELINDNLA